MKTLNDLLNSDMGDVIDWLEDNADKYYLVPKDFISEDSKDILRDSVEGIAEGAPRGEVYDDLDEIETIMEAVCNIIEEGL